MTFGSNWRRLSSCLTIVLLVSSAVPVHAAYDPSETTRIYESTGAAEAAVHAYRTCRDTEEGKACAQALFYFFISGQTRLAIRLLRDARPTKLRYEAELMMELLARRKLVRDGLFEKVAAAIGEANLANKALEIRAAIGLLEYAEKGLPWNAKKYEALVKHCKSLVTQRLALKTISAMRTQFMFVFDASKVRDFKKWRGEYHGCEIVAQADGTFRFPRDGWANEFVILKRGTTTAAIPNLANLSGKKGRRQVYRSAIKLCNNSATRPLGTALLETSTLVEWIDVPVSGISSGLRKQKTYHGCPVKFTNDLMRVPKYGWSRLQSAVLNLLSGEEQRAEKILTSKKKSSLNNKEPSSRELKFEQQLVRNGILKGSLEYSDLVERIGLAIGFKDVAKVGRKASAMRLIKRGEAGKKFLNVHQEQLVQICTAKNTKIYGEKVLASLKSGTLLINLSSDPGFEQGIKTDFFGCTIRSGKLGLRLPLFGWTKPVVEIVSLDNKTRLEMPVWSKRNREVLPELVFSSLSKMCGDARFKGFAARMLDVLPTSSRMILEVAELKEWSKLRANYNGCALKADEGKLILPAGGWPKAKAVLRYGAKNKTTIEVKPGTSKINLDKVVWAQPKLFIARVPNKVKVFIDDKQLETKTSSSGAGGVWTRGFFGAHTVRVESPGRSSWEKDYDALYGAKLTFQARLDLEPPWWRDYARWGGAGLSAGGIALIVSGASLASQAKYIFEDSLQQANQAYLPGAYQNAKEDEATANLLAGLGYSIGSVGLTALGFAIYDWIDSDRTAPEWRK